MGKITLEKVQKKFGDVEVIPPLDLTINDGEFVVFVGPSGCGKSTLLRLIAGLEDVSGGQIRIDGEDATGMPPAKRGLAMVFQSYALYPHMSVRKNIAFPMRMAGLSEAEQKKRIDAAAHALNLTDYLDRKPGQLSGGQRQRVAIGRAIVREPSAFLFDEPLSNLDAALRVNMRLEISELHQTLKTTMVYVTHDQVEAMTMADKIVVLRAGHIEQVGSPLDLYRHPDNRFVAGFIGSPKMNFIEGPRAHAEQAHALGIRPEHIDLSQTPVQGAIEGRVGVSEHLGSDTFAHVHSEEVGQINVRVAGDIDVHAGDTVWLSPQPQNLHRFDEAGLALR
ncbi:ABC transporter ATP-binding protein [Rhodobacteraceae bacterium]|nr:ABC transporter ATP-binding protein [Paracoccaceae bacterium]